MLLPLALIAGESWARSDGVHVSSSLSSYYHSAMHDVFVASLCIIAVLLVTYLAGQPCTWDCRLSLGAGIALLAVVFFPIGRPGLAPGAPRCGSTPEPSGCSPLDQLLGEARTEQIHLISAAVCFLLLATLSFLFARRERMNGGNLGTAGFHRACGVVILLSVAAAALGSYREFHLGPFPLLFAAETAAVWAFGASWLLAGRELWLRLLQPRRRAWPPDPACPDPGDAPPDRSSALAGTWTSTGQPAGWFWDPYDEPHRRSERWFDGASWTPATRHASGGSSGVTAPRPPFDEAPLLREFALPPALSDRGQHVDIDR